MLTLCFYPRSELKRLAEMLHTHKKISFDSLDYLTSGVPDVAAPIELPPQDSPQPTPQIEQTASPAESSKVFFHILLSFSRLLLIC